MSSLRETFVRRLPIVVVGAAICFYAVMFSWFSIGRAANFNAGWYDLGIMAQTVWRTGHGLGFTFTNPEAGPAGRHGLETIRTAIHADYLLILLAPLSWFGSTWQNLLVVQAIVVAWGAWFVYRIATYLLRAEWAGAVLAWAYVLYSPLQFATLFEFHAVTLGVTFFLAAVDSILRDRRIAAWVWIGLALLTKEQAGISLGLLAAAMWVWKGQRKLAVWSAAVCFGWVLLHFLVVIPASRPGQPATFVSGKFYQASEGSLAIVKRLAHPKFVYRRLNTRVHRSNVVQLLAPFGAVLPIVSPVTYLLIPELLLYWLSDSPNQQTLYLHYQALLIPFIVVGAVFGGRWLWQISARRLAESRRRRLLWAPMLLVVLGTGWGVWRMSPWPWSPITRWPLVDWRERQTQDVTEMLSLLPPKASVAVTQNLGPQVSGRARVTLLPTGALTEDYIVILERAITATTVTNDKRLAERDMLNLLLAYVESEPDAYRVAYHKGRVRLIQRRGKPVKPEPVWPDNLLGR